jgi:hypothetical protein
MATIPHVATQPDPIHAAIARHRSAYEAYQVASQGKAAITSTGECDAAADALVVTSCTSRFGALALLGHLRWWLAHEAGFSTADRPSYDIAKARAADLTLFLGTNLPPVAIPRATPMGCLSARRLSEPLPPQSIYRRRAPMRPPNENLPGEIEPWQATSAVRPDTAFVRALRVMDASGEFLAAIAIIAGGTLLTALATLA